MRIVVAVVIALVLAACAPRPVGCSWIDVAQHDPWCSFPNSPY